MTALYYKRETCRLCHSRNVGLAVELMPMPIATPNFDIPDSAKDAPIFKESVPLELSLCDDCGLVQVFHVGNPEIQYRNYRYTTSVSLGLSKHFLRYADDVLASTGIPGNARVVELGSNDGTLLRAFKERGMRVLGVDPARDIAERATASGIETLPTFFNSEVADRILNDHGPADVLIANNVIANIDDLDDLGRGVRTVLASDGVFIFETQYGADVFKKNLLDTIYHEHLSYFFIKPLKSYFAALGMELFDVEPISTKGGSIRVSVQHAGGARAVSPTVDALIDAEVADGFYERAIYQRFVADIGALREQLKAIVAEQRHLGKPVAGYGVSVGTTTLLPQFGLEKDIDFLFDDDPGKDPVLSGPDYEIPVFQSDAVCQKMPGAIIIFAWRYADPIMEKNQAYRNQGGKFIVPLPGVTER